MYSPGVAGKNFCSINDAIPMQFRSTEVAAQYPPLFFFCRELIDAAVCYPAALQQSGACTSWGS